jgi:hypothetical protein
MPTHRGSFISARSSCTYGTLPRVDADSTGVSMKKLLILLVLVLIGVAVAKKLREAEH